MSRAYRITVKESLTRELKGSDEIATKLEVLEILPPEQMAGLLAEELKNRGFEEREDGTFVRKDGKVTITVEPCTGEVTVKSESGETVTLEAKRDASAYDDIGPGEKSIRDRVREQIKQDLEKKAERETERLQTQATQELERRLEELQPELGAVVNKITREALKQKAQQMGTVKEIAEDEETGNLTIKVEVYFRMSVYIPESQLPASLTPQEAVEAAYSSEMAEVAGHLVRGLPSLVECDKELAPYLFVNLRSRLKDQNLRCIYLDGRPREADQQGGPMPVGLIGTMISQLREAVRGAVERRVVVLPHLDLLTTSQGGLTGEAREVIPLLYENPELVWLGFKDPSFPLPKVIENLFPHRTSILGTSRNRLRHLVTQKEARKFGRQFNPWQLYKFVSGVSAVRLRKLLATLEGEDYPADPKSAYRQLRQATLSATLEIPDVDLDRDIGGYEKTKKQLRQEILDVLQKRDNSTNPDEIARFEDLIPRGMIFWGPPGTGKTFFAKAIATSIGAAITIVSGPELKSKWVGESEENLRQVFHRARQSAPAIIVFDELDSFATARGTYTGSGVEHSMVNQLLTEMDGFHKDELVFVVGTTNFVESLDSALLRPGRFEFHLHIPYPDDKDRREILKIYDRKMNLQFTEDALDFAVRRTGENFMTATGTAFSGDHLNALCRAVARVRLRENVTGPTTPKEVERGLTEYEEKVELTDRDAVLVATHEAGHFVVSLFCPHHPPPERVTIQSEMPWAPFYTGYKKDDARKVGYTRNELYDRLCVLYGGIEAERLLIGDVSTGASAFGDPRSDLFRATQLAALLVEACGMSNLTAPLRVFRDEKGERDVLSGQMAEQIDRQVNTVIVEAQARAAKILTDHKDELVRLRDELLEKKTLEPDRVNAIIAEVRKRYAIEVADALENPPLPTAAPDDRTPLDKPAVAPVPRRSTPATTGEK